MPLGDVEHRDAAGLASSQYSNASELGETTTLQVVSAKYEHF
jgi:hypothetical protein